MGQVSVDADDASARGAGRSLPQVRNPGSDLSEGDGGTGSSLPQARNPGSDLLEGDSFDRISEYLFRKDGTGSDEDEDSEDPNDEFGRVVFYSRPDHPHFSLIKKIYDSCLDNDKDAFVSTKRELLRMHHESDSQDDMCEWLRKMCQTSEGAAAESAAPPAPPSSND